MLTALPRPRAPLVAGWPIRCSRNGRYSVRKLVEQRGRDASMMKWKERLNNDCPKRDVPQLHDRCDLICPVLPKVL
jgi:hypothetical protein